VGEEEATGEFDVHHRHHHFFSFWLEKQKMGTLYTRESVCVCME